MLLIVVGAPFRCIDRYIEATLDGYRYTPIDSSIDVSIDTFSGTWTYTSIVTWVDTLIAAFIKRLVLIVVGDPSDA